MELFRIIKSDAKSAMGLFGGRAVASFLIVLLAYLAVNCVHSILLYIFSDFSMIGIDIYNIRGISPKILAVTGGCSLLYLFVMSGFSIGHAKLHFAFAEGKDESVFLIFETFSSFKKFFGSVLFYLGYAFRVAFTAVFAVLPGGILFYFMSSHFPDAEGALGILRAAGYGVSYILFILCASLWLIFIQRWELAKYYFIGGRGINKSFSFSAKATKNICYEIIRFKLSFIGWAFASFLVLPLVWTVPYYELSKTIFYKYLMERYERSLAHIPETDFSA